MRLIGPLLTILPPEPKRLRGDVGNCITPLNVKRQLFFGRTKMSHLAVSLADRLTFYRARTDLQAGIPRPPPNAQ